MIKNYATGATICVEVLHLLLKSLSIVSVSSGSLPTYSQK